MTALYAVGEFTVKQSNGNLLWTSFGKLIDVLDVACESNPEVTRGSGPLEVKNVATGERVFNERRQDIEIANTPQALNKNDGNGIPIDRHSHGSSTIGHPHRHRHPDHSKYSHGPHPDCSTRAFSQSFSTICLALRAHHSRCLFGNENPERSSARLTLTHARTSTVLACCCTSY